MCVQRTIVALSLLTEPGEESLAVVDVRDMQNADAGMGCIGTSHAAEKVVSRCTVSYRCAHGFVE